MEQKDIEELENKREKNRGLHVWQKATNIARPTLLVNALIAIIWDKMISFKNLTKLGREHKLLELLIIATRDEIQNKGNFPCLVTVISEVKLRKKVEDIRELTVKTSKRVVELSCQWAQLAQECQQDLETHNEIVDILKTSQRMLNYKASLEFATEKKFCDTHMEQQLKKMLVSYDNLVKEFNSTEDDQNTEDVLTTTICTFLNKRHAKLEGMLEYWMDQYEKQLDEKQKKMEHLRKKRSQQWDQTFHLLKQYTKESNIVEGYKNELREMELRATRENRQASATVRIQAWWRGTMVQRHLDSFRVKKQGKGDKKGNKK